MANNKLLKLIKGFMIVSIENENYERTLNLLRRKGVLIWDIKRTEKGISFKIYNEAYKDNKELFDNIGITILKRRGILFKAKKLFSRKGFILGAIALFVYVIIYCSYVWDIEIIGNDNLKSKDIIEALEENNYKPPLKINQLDKESIQDVVYNNFKELKFVEAYVEGTKLVLFVKEKKKIDIYYAEDYPASIIASKPAVIKKVLVKQGSTVIKEGDVVDKGQTLVEGYYLDHEGVENLVHAEGSILGITYYNIVLEEPKVQSRTVETGEKNNIYNLCIGDKEIKLFGKKNVFSEYDEKVNVYSIPLISDKLNLYIKRQKQYELTHDDDIATEEYIEGKLKIELYKQLIDKCSPKSSIYKENIEITESDDKYILNAKIELLEDICEIVKIHTIDRDINNNINSNE